MELGEKLRNARLAAGLSQRQLCGDVITRNMLSQIEHGTARPSMNTLQYLAEKLEKPMSYFLEEEMHVSPNQQLLERARTASGMEARLILKDFKLPDPLLEWEWRYRSFLAALGAAQQAMEEGKTRFAHQLLEEAGEIRHGIPELERSRLLLLGKLPETEPAEIVPQLPSLDDELLLRAEAALAGENIPRVLALLDAAENQESPAWNFLRGRALLLQKEYALAAVYFKKAEDCLPDQCIPLLEICFRELGDFKLAYAYACKQR